MNYEQAETARKYISELMVSIADDLLPAPKVRVSVSDVISNGKVKIHDAVESVIARHEKELKAIENKAKAEKQSALESFYRSGTCADGAHQQRMAALMANGHQQYLDSLVGSFNRSMHRVSIDAADKQRVSALTGQYGGVFGGWS
jgi:hypothetical protein